MCETRAIWSIARDTVVSPPGTFVIAVASAGSMKPGKGALTPIAAGFCAGTPSLGQAQVKLPGMALVTLDEILDG
jgi:hypothetical protein